MHREQCRSISPINRLEFEQFHNRCTITDPTVPGYSLEVLLVHAFGNGKTKKSMVVVWIDVRSTLSSRQGALPLALQRVRDQAMNGLVKKKESSEVCHNEKSPCIFKRRTSMTKIE